MSSIRRGRGAWVAVLFLAVPAFMGSTACADGPWPIQLQAARDLEQRGHWYIRWDEKTGSPATISEQRLSVGAAYRRRRSFSPEAVVEVFLRRHAGLFPLRIGSDSLRVIERNDSRDPRRRGHTVTLRMEQVYKGVPVVEGEYAVSMSPDGIVLFLNGRFQRGVDVDTSPTLDLETCRRIALNEIGAGADSGVSEPRLMVKRIDRDHLVWSMNVTQTPLAVWQVLIDAHDGSVVGRYNRVITDPW